MNAKNSGLRLLEHKLEELGLRDFVQDELIHLTVTLWVSDW